MEEVQEPGPSQGNLEFAETVARYDEVLSKCKLLRSRLLLISANSPLNGRELKNSSLEDLNILEILDNIEEQFQQWSIQEEMLKEVKVSKLALELLSHDEPYCGVDELLKQHCANQAKLFGLAKSIRVERLAQKEAIGQLLDQLIQYTVSLKDDQIKLESDSSVDSDSLLQRKKNMEKQIKEIRFMQICISQMIFMKDVDLRRNHVMKRILEACRNPVSSVEDFL